MLKNQDLLVVLKVLSFEESSHESLSLTRELQGEAWVHLGNDVEKISQYDMI